jgi:hypothetical protein
MEQRLDPYKVLGVDRAAPIEVIQSAYRALAKKYHPDVNPNDPDATTKFRAVADAFERIGTPVQRAAWDRLHPPTSSVPPRQQYAPRPPQSSTTPPPKPPTGRTYPSGSTAARPQRNRKTTGTDRNRQVRTHPHAQKVLVVLLSVGTLFYVAAAIHDGGTSSPPKTGRLAAPTAASTSRTMTKPPSPTPTQPADPCDGWNSFVDGLNAIDAKYAQVHSEISNYTYPSGADYSRWLVALDAEQNDLAALKPPSAAFDYYVTRSLYLSSLIDSLRSYYNGRYTNGDASATEVAKWISAESRQIPIMNAKCASGA